MGKRSLLVAFLVVASILAIMLGSSLVTAVIVTGDGGGSIAEGCKKSIVCGDNVVDYGEDCEPAYYGPYQSDVCPDGTVRYKSCGSDCKWKYDPATCPVCGNGKAESGEACDWGTKNGVWSSTFISCGSDSISAHYTCSQDCTQFIYDKTCPDCGNGVWDPPEEDCDWGPNGKEGVGATTICPDGTIQRTDCSGSCTWVKVPPVCPPPKDCRTTPELCDAATETCDQATGKCEPKPDACSTATECGADGKSIVTTAQCKNSAGTLTKDEKTANACGADMLCAKEAGGSVGCVRDCSNAWDCSPWGSCVNNVQTRSCTSKYPECANQPQLQQSCTTVTTTTCTPGAVNPGSHQCTGCNTAVEVACNSAGTGHLTRSVTDNSCTSGCGGPGPGPEPFCGDGACNGGESCSTCPGDCGACGAPPPSTCVPATPCSTLGCGSTDSCGKYCGDCAPPPGVDPCAGVSDPDKSKACCESKGFVWAKSGEARAFGGFAKLGQAGCVGDDSGEFVRFRECEGGACTTDATDSAACASANSCVLNSNCFTRLDKSVEEEPQISALVQNCQGQNDDNCKLLKQLDEAEKKAGNTQSREEKRKIVKDEIAQKIAELKKRGIIKENENAAQAGQGGSAVTNAVGISPKVPGVTPGSAGSTLLCLPKP